VSDLFFLEPTDSAAWAPFTGVRPVAELRAGAWLIRERWEAALGLRASGILSDTLLGFADVDSPAIVPGSSITGPAIIVRSDVVPPRAAVSVSTRRLVADGRTIAWRLDRGETWEGPDDRGDATGVDAHLLPGAWGLIDALERFLASDCLEFTAAPADPVPAGSIVIGDSSRVVCLDAAVEPGVVFDTRKGAIVLTEGVEVRSGTRLEGPLFAGPGTFLLGGQIRHSSFGPHCRVHGEMATTVMIGYGNKGHDGFVGHSVIGCWTNLGAGTITSNLKNTYGTVRLEVGTERRETGRTFLGSLIADHAKTAIGSLLSTGTVIGAGASVTGSPVPRAVPPFAWGNDGLGRLDEEAFVRIAGRVLPRRNVELTPVREAWLRSLHARMVR
jgi:UDP-N-acetylglucosamine diphosphorylase/glucosamine-1-phosphate N-acetyltransferase